MIWACISYFEVRSIILHDFKILLVFLLLNELKILDENIAFWQDSGEKHSTCNKILEKNIALWQEINHFDKSFWKWLASCAEYAQTRTFSFKNNTKKEILPICFLSLNSCILFCRRVIGVDLLNLIGQVTAISHPMRFVFLHLILYFYIFTSFFTINFHFVNISASQRWLH